MRRNYYCVENSNGQWGIGQRKQIQPIQLRKRNQIVNLERALRVIFRTVENRMRGNLLHTMSAINHFEGQDYFKSIIIPTSQSYMKRSLVSGCSTTQSSSPRSHQKVSVMSFTDSVFLNGHKLKSAQCLLQALRSRLNKNVQHGFIMLRFMSTVPQKLKIAENKTLKLQQIVSLLNARLQTIKSVTFLTIRINTHLAISLKMQQQQEFAKKAYNFLRKRRHAVILVIFEEFLNFSRTKETQEVTARQIVQKLIHQQQITGSELTIEQITRESRDRKQIKLRKLIEILHRVQLSVAFQQLRIRQKQKALAMSIACVYYLANEGCKQGFNLIKHRYFINKGLQQISFIIRRKTTGYMQELIAFKRQCDKATCDQANIKPDQAQINDQNNLDDDPDLPMKIKLLGKLFEKKAKSRGSVYYESVLPRRIRTGDMVKSQIVHFEKSLDVLQEKPPVIVVTLASSQEELQTTNEKMHADIGLGLLQIPIRASSSSKILPQSSSGNQLQLNFIRSISLNNPMKMKRSTGEEVEVERRMMFNFSNPIERKLRKSEHPQEELHLEQSVLNKSSKWKTCQQMTNMFVMNKSVNNQVRVFQPKLNTIFDDFNQKDKVYFLPQAIYDARHTSALTPKQSISSVIDAVRLQKKPSLRGKKVLRNVQLYKQHLFGEKEQEIHILEPHEPTIRRNFAQLLQAYYLLVIIVTILFLLNYGQQDGLELNQ